ncbi:penicillin-binding protein [Lapidilactobacillus bayanensis]|uniref:penicillin-binding protein n=1 Tax=Lapidilactobacillus bayanensis TaxID=2485998 RepID=UPI000F78DF44|nr:penicillin-binding protein [Lapidilactobacillus bayanensis]
MKQFSQNDQQKSRRTRRNRVIVGLILIVAMSAVLLLFISRFAYIATSGHVGSVDLTKKSEQKYSQNKVLLGKRGTIYDVNGNIIAEDSNVYSVYAVLDTKYNDTAGKPLHVVNKKKTAKVLSQYLPLSQKKILTFLNKKNQFQVEFGSAGKNLSLNTKKKIEAEKLPGIQFTDTPSRLYPNGTFASHIVGLAQLSTANQKATKRDATTTNEKLTGILGVEKYFNNILAGTNGVQTSKRDTFGYEIPNSKVVTKQPKDGSSVYLTLDARLQSYLEQLMTSAQEKYKPVKLTAVLMNAKTGKIIAASQRPTFNASTKKGIGSMWRDSLVEDAYEPGSVFKLLTISSAIDAGTYQPNKYYKSGSVKVGDRTIYDWNKNGWGWIPFYQAIPRSSNTGLVQIEQQLGAKKYAKYLKKFHVGEKTGITLPGEVSGNLNLKSAVSQATTAFGQGVDVTVVQMMQYLSAIANNGTMVQPQIVDHTVSSTGKVKDYDTKVVGHPIKASTAKKVRKIMEQVVTADYGTGRAYKIPGYQIAVKTGTAQLAGSNGSYLTGSGDYIFSVAGMAPAKDPKYILYVTMQQPKNMTASESQMMSSIFNPLMKRALKSEVSDSDLNANSISMPKLTDLTMSSAKTKLQALGLTVSQVGTGSKVVQQLPVAGEKVIKNQRVVLLTEGAMTMPNVKGWSKNDVLKLAEITGRDFKLSGTGYAASQSVKAGSVIPSTGTVTIKLKEPD